ncbi:hypothetical protein NX059_009565 [Plenodomus lindquistii]|nr:hypothetical protein NX059_009565 [Plenodomus lindquistii]
MLDYDVHEPQTPHSPPFNKLQPLCGHWVYPAYFEQTLVKICLQYRMRTALLDVVDAKEWLMRMGDLEELNDKDREAYRAKLFNRLSRQEQ